MNLLTIAVRSIKQRFLSSTLTMISMALGVGLVVAVLAIFGIVQKSFNANATLGYNMVIGAKGGKLQLVLNSVYYLSEPIENIPYDYYLEFQNQEVREKQYSGSYSYKAVQHQQAARVTLLASGFGMTSPAAIVTALAADAIVEQHHEHLYPWKREGKYSAFTDFAIPLCLGDYVGPYRVVGTTPDMFSLLKYGPKGDQDYALDGNGRNFDYFTEENGFFEALVGSVVADDRGLKVGDTINPSHGSAEGDAHATKFVVVGILESTGTPNDRAVFINMEGFYRMSDHAKPLENEDDVFGTNQIAHKITDADYILPVEKREVTSMLVRMDPLYSIGIENQVNEGNVAQAVFPITEIRRLLDYFVSPVQTLLLVLTVLICFMSGVSILVSIYNSMSDRRSEIAVLRALGARRGTVYNIVLLESMVLSLVGGLMGILGGHGLIAAFSGVIEDQTGVQIGFFELAPPLPIPVLNSISSEFLVIPGLVLLAIIVGFIPATSAYKTDVSKSLGK
ncbi:MAG: peptide ABC transporter permease [Rhodopirellula sp.]|mgnify:FL=1|nr:peptide ABC transporter permease [Rhodopirellula sp.]|tara:strand:+ start:205 stop:1725 length:1521 start_codon:yes stop_codon:yes gene_type:complete